MSAHTLTVVGLGDNCEVHSLTSGALADSVTPLPHNLHLIHDLLVLKFYHHQLCSGEMTDSGADITKLAKSLYCVIIIIIETKEALWQM